MYEILSGEHDRTDAKARKLAAKNLPYCQNTINKIIKEKVIFGNVVDGASPKSRISQFNRLSLEMKDKIRFAVSTFSKWDTLQFECFEFSCQRLVGLFDVGTRLVQAKNRVLEFDFQELNTIQSI